MSRRAFKNSIVLFCVCVFAILSLAIGAIFYNSAANVAHANDVDTSETIYHFINSPNAIATSGNATFIADGNRIYRFMLDASTGLNTVEYVLTTQGEVRHLEVNLGTIITLETTPILGEPNAIALYNIMGDNSARPIAVIPASSAGGSDIAAGFTGFAIMSGLLYASFTNSRYVFVFDVNNLNYVRTMALNNHANIIINAPIAGLAASGNRLIVVHTVGGLSVRLFQPLLFEGNNILLYQASEHGFGGAVSFDHVRYISSSQEILIFSSGVIFLVCHNTLAFREFTTVYTAALRGVSADAAGRVLKLNDRGSLSDFAIERPTANAAVFTNERILLASRHHISGFFDMPQDATSSNGRVFVADYINDRVSIQNQDNSFNFLPITRPRAISARYGQMFVSTNNTWIYQFDITTDNTFWIRQINFTPDGTVGTAINRLALCSRGYLFIIDVNNRLRVLSPTSIENPQARVFASLAQFNIHDTDVIISVYASVWSPNVYILRRSPGATTYEVLRLTPQGMSPTPALSGIVGARDIAVDKDGGIYVLAYYDYEYTITRHAINSIEPIEPIIITNGLYSPSSITLSQVDFRADSNDNALSHRDLIVTDTHRHRVFRIDAYTEFRNNYFYVDNYFVYYADFSLASQGFLNEFNPLRRGFIHTITAVYGAQLYLNATDVFRAVRYSRTNAMQTHVTLGYGFMVIVPFGLNHARDFTFIMADNLDYGQDVNNNWALAGYVRTTLLSNNPLSYSSAANETVYMMPSNDVAQVFIMPLHQLLPTSILAYRTRVILADFTFFSDEHGNIVHGYFDNRNRDLFPLLNDFNRWFRIFFECSYTGYLLEGFVQARALIPYAVIPPSYYITPNARVIRAFFDDANATGALIFAIGEDGQKQRDYYGNLVPHSLITNITFGHRVMVIGTFSTQNYYHRIRYNSTFGIIEVYIRTPNLEYDGVDIVALMAIILAGIVTILTGLAIARYLQIKKTFVPKKPAESFI